MVTFKYVFVNVLKHFKYIYTNLCCRVMYIHISFVVIDNCVLCCIENKSLSLVVQSDTKPMFIIGLVCGLMPELK
jgi:hypothetical protein